MISIDVLVLTYKRPAWLADNLRSLANQQLSSDIRMAVIVVDNDNCQSARAIVMQSVHLFRDIRYVCEPVANVAVARNRALAESTSELVAFIDDDEMAEPCWLESLVRAHWQFAAPIVFGPVVARLAPGAPRWAINGRFFDRPRFKSGATVITGGTGNVLLQADAVRRSCVSFNSDYGRCGGEDTLFFSGLSAAGLQGVWCDEAVVIEQVGLDRLSARWLLRRAFRGGCNYARMFVGDRSRSERSVRLLLHSAACLGCFCLVPFAALAGFANALRMGQRCAKQLGRCAGLWQSLEVGEGNPNEPHAAT